jgi:hypothetical protein
VPFPLPEDGSRAGFRKTAPHLQAGERLSPKKKRDFSKSRSVPSSGSHTLACWYVLSPTYFTFNCLFQSKVTGVVQRDQIRRIGRVIKTLEAQVGQFLLGCKCPVNLFLPGLAKDLSAPLYIFELTIYNHSYWNIMKNFCVCNQHLLTMVLCPFVNNSTSI